MKREMIKTMDLLHEMAISPLRELEWKFGKTWSKTQEVLKENLFSNFEWKDGVTVVNILKRNGELEKEKYTVTKGALFEIVRDGFYVVPSTFSYTFKVWNDKTMESIETMILTEAWQKSDILGLFEDWEERNNIDYSYFNKWSITRH